MAATCRRGARRAEECTPGARADPACQAVDTRVTTHWSRSTRSPVHAPGSPALRRGAGRVRLRHRGGRGGAWRGMAAHSWTPRPSISWSARDGGARPQRLRPQPRGRTAPYDGLGYDVAAEALNLPRSAPGERPVVGELAAQWRRTASTSCLCSSMNGRRCRARRRACGGPRQSSRRRSRTRRPSCRPPNVRCWQRRWHARRLLLAVALVAELLVEVVVDDAGTVVRCCWHARRYPRPGRRAMRLALQVALGGARGRMDHDGGHDDDRGDDQPARRRPTPWRGTCTPPAPTPSRAV